jgi:phage tail-like protein
MATRDHHYHRGGTTTSTFLVEIDGDVLGRFWEVQGLQVEVEVEEYQEGGVNGFVHQLPGRMSWPHLILKRGVTYDNSLLEWFQASTGTGFAKENKVARETFAVTLISPGGQRLRGWNFHDAIPIRWTGPSFATDKDEVPTEELEVVHHGFEAITFT